MATKAKATASKSTKTATRGVDRRYRASRVYTSAKKLSLANLPTQFARADLEFIGVDHSGASYEARVFINNPNADGNTPKVDADGYVGSFSIFGHGGCFGDVGHCDVHTAPDEFDPRPSHPLMPIRKIVIATSAIKNAALKNPDITITVVPVVTGWTEKSDLEDVLKFDHINLVTYD